MVTLSYLSKGDARIPVVDEYPNIFEAVIRSILAQDILLMLNAPGDPFLFILSGEAAVQGCDFMI